MNDTSLAKHFTIKDLIKYTVPSMFMMVVYSTYILFDGLFISNFVGSTAYASVNMVGNYLLVFPAIGTMIGSGGSSLISKTLGEDNREKASEIFSMIVWLSIILGCVFTGICFNSIEWSARLQGADGQLLKDCLEYGKNCILFYPVLHCADGISVFFYNGRKGRSGICICTAFRSNQYSIGCPVYHCI
ncbi:MAG: MATE family efflux transporter [Eubacteriales bacterium]|nr:MATE family efflux transporter [Eubacteriales bacterium]